MLRVAKTNMKTIGSDEKRSFKFSIRADVATFFITLLVTKDISFSLLLFAAWQIR